MRLHEEFLAIGTSIYPEIYSSQANISPEPDDLVTLDMPKPTLALPAIDIQVEQLSSSDESSKMLKKRKRIIGRKSGVLNNAWCSHLPAYQALSKKDQIRTDSAANLVVKMGLNKCFEYAVNYTKLLLQNNSIAKPPLNSTTAPKNKKKNMQR